MARASNIYLLYHLDKLIGWFTVKYEMVHWAQHKSGHGSDELRCVRVRDGRPGEPGVEIPFVDEFGEPVSWERPTGSKAEEVARKLAKHFIQTGQMGP